MGKLKDLLSLLFTTMKGVADGTCAVQDMPTPDVFLNRIFHAIAICTDSLEDQRSMKRKMAGVASQRAKTCQIGDAMGWRNTAAALLADEKGGQVRRY